MEDLTLNNSEENTQEEVSDLLDSTDTSFDVPVEGDLLEENEISATQEAEHIYSLIASAVPKKDGFRKNIGKRDFALWVLPILAINRIRRFTRKNADVIIQPYTESKTSKFKIKTTETVYTSTKNVFNGNETMKFFGPRFMSIWVLPMAITGAFMEFLFVGPLNGTNPFG